MNGGAAHGKYLMPVSAGFSKPVPSKPRFSYDDLDNVLDQMAAEDPSSESDGEIELPPRRGEADMRMA